MRAHHLLVSFILLAFVLSGACEASPEPLRAVPVTLERGGDDGLTSRIGDAIEAGVMASRHLTMNVDAGDPLVITIPTNAGWRERGKRTVVSVRADFSRGSQALGHITATCDETRLAECARLIVFAAEARSRGT